MYLNTSSRSLSFSANNQACSMTLSMNSRGSFNLSPVDKAKAESLDLHSDLLEFLENDKVTLELLANELVFVQSKPNDAQPIGLDKLSLELQCQDFGQQNAKEQRLMQEYREMASADFTYRNYSLDFDPVARRAPPDYIR
jgi:hypothetical protein